MHSVLFSEKTILYVENSDILSFFLKKKRHENKYNVWRTTSNQSTWLRGQFNRLHCFHNIYSAAPLNEDKTGLVMKLRLTCWLILFVRPNQRISSWNRSEMLFYSHCSQWSLQKLMKKQPHCVMWSKSLLKNSLFECHCLSATCHFMTLEVSRALIKLHAVNTAVIVLCKWKHNYWCLFSMFWKREIRGLVWGLRQNDANS